MTDIHHAVIQPSGSSLALLRQEFSQKFAPGYEAMSRREDYGQQLQGARDVIAFLRKESRLPRPRANLELLDAAADADDQWPYRRWIATGAGHDPTDEFVAMCGVVGLGRLIAEGATELVTDLRAARAIQAGESGRPLRLPSSGVGDHDVGALFGIVQPRGTARPFMQRAAVAAVCEPRFLKAPAASRRALDLLDRVTASIGRASDRKSDEFRALRQAMGYCWSVAVAANPEQGKPAFERWASSSDPDIRWIVAENLKKARLKEMDPRWAARLTALGSRRG